MRNPYRILVGTLRGIDHSELYIDGKITLEWRNGVGMCVLYSCGLG